ncbi:AbrB family transcriptional regulator [Virgibacillus sp. DJP39]|uniref:AbrB/MazE/SpoVT family DNA-binding domain-containing protein n=1 Tax=Virgibacillus sp. DJP39 TaxID=3409790 RepID=UPI003BB7846B
MERKVTKIGNSLGITFSKKIMNEFDWKEDDIVKIEIDKERIILRKSNKVELPEGVTEEVFNEFLKKYKDEGRQNKEVEGEDGEIKENKERMES